MNRALYTERQAKIIKLFYISSLLSSFNNFSFNCDFILFSTSNGELLPEISTFTHTHSTKHTITTSAPANHFKSSCSMNLQLSMNTMPATTGMA